MFKNILAIETSCDETAVSIISYHQAKKSVAVLAHIVESQIASHAPFGGVVPEIAARDHLSKIDSIAHSALAESGLSIHDINSVCVTLGPGLIGALMVGVLYARGLALALKIPLIGVNHVHAHLAPCFLLPSDFNLKKHIKKHLQIPQVEFPVLALTVSGGHCHLTLIRSFEDRQILGRTLDDACGEAFDKVAKMLKLSYPGGPAVEKLAQEADPNLVELFSFPQPFAHKDPHYNRYNFSYSGLKTACLKHVNQVLMDPAVKPRDDTTRRDDTTSRDDIGNKFAAIAAAFQNAALLQLKTRMDNALADHPEVKTIVVAGGVAQNRVFYELFTKSFAKSYVIRFAPKELCSDNATMIALHAILDHSVDAMNIQPFSRFSY